ncbi:DUF1840 domain-containing protein [Acidovorax sp. MR-S7]|uniref:DUF1840 domain-containing protein n=1 Tax=Acidovorax sp. MR-S7 TaxID=1268622 RepID=UPI0003781EF2|nr:DUF1840 domain-containing protein [Acidovorax sp. MR-S7]GAD22933.1 hypothetical protein AVS7_02693 [Acidovorax sp. MR-S7]
MLFKFKSRSTADLIMLEPNGRQLLEIIGKSPDPHGIVTAAQIPAAIQALQDAIAAEEAAQQAHADEGDEADEGGQEPRSDAVRLRQRATPFIDMLRRSAAEGHDVVW